MRLPIVSAGYQGRSTNIDASRMVNLFPELTPDGKHISALIWTPGTSLWTSVGTIVRGMHVFNNLLYVVTGGYLYSVNAAGVKSAPLYALATASGRVAMADNGLAPTGGNQLVISDGTKIYVWNVNTVSGTTVNVAANTICFINGYFAADIGTCNWQISALYDGTTWNALDKSTADAYPDNLLAVFNNQMQLWLLGEYSTEMWYQTGIASPNIFARVTNGVIEMGTVSRWAVAKANNSLYWAATHKINDSGEFVGFVENGIVISPPSINYTVSRYSTISDAFAYAYSDGSHTFVVFTFPTANATWVFDATTRMWHERSTYTNNPYQVSRHVSNCYAYFNGLHLVGDWQNGNIYQMDYSFLTDNGLPMVAMRTSAHVNDKDEYNNFVTDRLWIDAETGVGDSTGINPMAELSWSSDGGHNWSNGYQASLGKIGKYGTRLLWRRLGIGRDRIYRLIISDPVKRVLISSGHKIRGGYA